MEAKLNCSNPHSLHLQQAKPRMDTVVAKAPHPATATHWVGWISIVPDQSVLAPNLVPSINIEHQLTVFVSNNAFRHELLLENGDLLAFQHVPHPYGQSIWYLCRLSHGHHKILEVSMLILSDTHHGSPSTSS